MKLKHINLLMCIIVTIISSCGDPKAPEVADTTQLKVKSSIDTAKYPYKRVDMETDSVVSVIEVRYGFISCPCAQWFIKGDTAMYREHFYLERANNKLKDAEDILDGTNFITLRLTGKFYKNKGYPIGYNPAKGHPDPARVFRYSKLVVLENNHPYQK